MSGNTSLVQRPILVTIIFSLLVLLGAYLAMQLSVALFPDINPPFVVVMTRYSDAGPETVEKTVTKVLESALVNVNGIKKMSSTSSSGSSMISLQFDYGKNLETATNDVRDKLGSVSSALPSAADSPQIFKFDPNSQPILQIALQSAKRSAEELRTMAEDNVINDLQRIDGVSEAAVSGGRVAVVRVDVAQDRLDAYGLTLTAVSNAIAAQSRELGGGKITENGKNFSVKTVGEFKNVSEVADSVIEIKNGYGVKLSDIAKVRLEYKDEDSNVIINGQSGVYVSVKKQSGGNTVKIAGLVLKSLPDIQKKIPSDVKLVVVSNDTTQINNTVNTLVRAAIEAIIYAMLVIFVFLRSIKTTFIIGLSIPISIATTFLAMYFLGLTLNIFTMTGLILGVGMIVDDSIVIMENIVRYRDRGMKNLVAAIIGSNEMKRAVIASTLTTIFVFVPFLIFKNKLEIVGILFQDMLITIVISLLSSLAVALFLVPVLISKYFPLANRLEKPLRNPIVIVGDRVLSQAYDRLSGFYRWLLTKAMNNRKIVVLGIVLAFLLAVGAIGGIKFVFAPSMGDESVTLNIELPIGTALGETKAVLVQLEEIAKSEIKGYQNIITTAGSGGSGAFSSSSGTYKGSIQVTLPAKAEQKDDSNRVKDIFRSHYAEFPGVTFSFAAGRGGNLSGSNAAIDLKLSSDDLDLAIATAQQMVNIIKTKVPLATEAAMDMNTGLPQVEVVVDRKKAYAMGVKVSNVATEVNASIAGVSATQYHQDGNDYDVLVALQNSDRSKVIDLDNIYVTNSSGARVSLANIAELKKGTGPLSIARENKSRVIHVTANTKPGASVPQVEQQIKEAIAANLVIDSKVHVSYEGDLSALMDMGLTMLVVIIMAIILIFGVMAGQYESLRDPLINLFTIPLMVIGVVAVYVISGQTMSMFSILGLLMLVGIVVKNGIVMVDYTNLLRERGMSVKQACIEAGVARLRPVLMTSLTAILGMIPLAFSQGEGGELVQPIGLTVIGGLTSSTLMTLFLIPVVYSIFNKEKHKEVAHEAA